MEVARAAQIRDHLHPHQMMTTDPINLITHPVPEGHYLVEGNHLQNVARASKIPFRLAQRYDKNPSHPTTVGVIIPEDRRADMDNALARSAVRKAREATYPSRQSGR